MFPIVKIGLFHSYHGKIKIYEEYIDDSKGQEHSHFTKDLIEEIKNELDNNTFKGEFTKV